MINLKLAQHSKEGKFEKFINMAGNKIRCYPETEAFMEDGFLLGCNGVHVGGDIDFYELDEKDPLNRFDGLFDGRTYGGGKFVLIPQSLVEGEMMSTDDIILHGLGRDEKFYSAALLMFIQNMRGGTKTNFVIREFDLESAVVDKLMNSEGPVITNLHENPELWSKIK